MHLTKGCFLGHTRTGYLLFSKTFQIALDMYKNTSNYTNHPAHFTSKAIWMPLQQLTHSHFLHNNLHTYISCIHADDIDLILRGAINRVCPPPKK